MYLYVQFDGIPLPPYQTSQDHGSGAADSAIRLTIGGAVDIYGSAPTPVRRREIMVSGLIMGERTQLVDESGNRLVDESGNLLVRFPDSTSATAWQLGALVERAGVRGTLIRKNIATGATQAATVRLLEVRHISAYSDRMGKLSVDLTFERVGNTWA